MVVYVFDVLLIIPQYRLSEDVWRVRDLAKLLKARGEAHYEGEDTHQMTVLIYSLCSS